MGECVAFFNEDLVTNAATRRIEVDTVLSGERLDGRVLRQILSGLVLDVMVEGED